MSKGFEKSSFLFGQNAVFIEDLYKKYMKDPRSIDDSWLQFFQDYHDENITLQNQIFTKETRKKEKDTSYLNTELISALSSNSKISTNFNDSNFAQLKQIRIQQLKEAYRARGHLCTNLDPLGLRKVKTREEAGLNLDSFGLSKADLTVNELNLDKIYCGSIAVEFTHLDNKEEIDWLYKKFENPINDLLLNTDIDDRKKYCLTI